jgi:hypothetical protein
MKDRSSRPDACQPREMVRTPSVLVAANQALPNPVRKYALPPSELRDMLTSTSWGSRLLLSRRKLLVALSEELDQSFHASLLDLLIELLPVCLDQPGAEHVQVI